MNKLTLRGRRTDKNCNIASRDIDAFIETANSQQDFTDSLSEFLQDCGAFFLRVQFSGVFEIVFAHPVQFFSQFVQMVQIIAINQNSGRRGNLVKNRLQCLDFLVVLLKQFGTITVAAFYTLL